MPRNALQETISALTNLHPGYEELVGQLCFLLDAGSPSFVFLQDMFAADRTRVILQDVITSVTNMNQGCSILPSFVDCVECYSAKVLYENVFSSLAHSTGNRRNVDLQDSYDGHRSIKTFDDFLMMLRDVSNVTRSKGTQLETATPSKIVLIFEHAERLRNNIPETIIPLTRIAEYSGCNVLTVFLSETEWEHLTPFSGKLSDPYRIILNPQPNEDVIETICRKFPEDEPVDVISPFHPSLKILFRHYVETVVSVCSSTVKSPVELAYVVSARWPGFVAPVLSDWRNQGTSNTFIPPSEPDRVRLIRAFLQSFSIALECLYPRVMNAMEWELLNSPSPDFRLSHLLQSTSRQVVSTVKSSSHQIVSQSSYLASFILVAAYLASCNPAKTDLRVFARETNEKLRRRKKGGGASRTSKSGTVSKIPQRLSGPTAFTYDRLKAILGSLLREYDEVGSRSNKHSSVHEEQEVYRVQVSASDLISSRLIHRTTPLEKLENTLYKCGISFEQANSLARKLKIPLKELLWENV